jgi:hypothetical protein
MTTSYTHRAETFRGIFYRLENEAAPMSPLHDVCYDYVVFRLSNGEYWQTDDVSGLPVGMVRLGRGKLVWSQGSWSNLVQKLQQTDFPPSFYAMPIP